MSAVDVKLESLKFAILFTIADHMRWLKKRNTRYQQSIQKIRNKNHPYSFFYPCKNFIHPEVNHSPD